MGNLTFATDPADKLSRPRWYCRVFRCWGGFRDLCQTKTRNWLIVSAKRFITSFSSTIVSRSCHRDEAQEGGVLASFSSKQQKKDFMKSLSLCKELQPNWCQLLLCELRLWKINTRNAFFTRNGFHILQPLFFAQSKEQRAFEQLLESVARNNWSHCALNEDLIIILWRTAPPLNLCNESYSLCGIHGDKDRTEETFIFEISTIISDCLIICRIRCSSREQHDGYEFSIWTTMPVYDGCDAFLATPMRLFKNKVIVGLGERR